MARDRRKSQDIHTTDTQLIRLLGLNDSKDGKGNFVNCALHSKQLQDMGESIKDLSGQVKKIDEAIRGNGDPGLKADLASVTKDLENHKKESNKSKLALRWRVGILISIIIALIPLVLYIHNTLTQEARTKETTKIIINEVVDRIEEINPKGD
jgi:hypothetical protein